MSEETPVQQDSKPMQPMKNEAAAAMARMRAAKLSPERRREIAIKAANSPRPNARNAGRPKKKE